MADEWYFQLSGQAYGPVTGKDLKARVAAGQITADTPVRQGPQGQWVAAKRFKGLIPEPAPSQPSFDLGAAAAPAEEEVPPIIAVGGGSRPQVESSPFAPTVGPAPSVGIAAPSSPGSVVSRGKGSRYPALLTVSKLYDLFAWVVLAIGTLGIVGGLFTSVIAIANVGFMAGAALLVYVVIGAIYTLLLFITMRAAAQAVILAMDVEKNTRRTNEILEGLSERMSR